MARMRRGTSRDWTNGRGAAVMDYAYALMDRRRSGDLTAPRAR